MAALGRASEADLGLWHFDGRLLRPLPGHDEENPQPVPPGGPGWRETRAGRAWFAPVPGVDGLWLSVRGVGDAPGMAATVMPALSAVVAADREAAQMSQELRDRVQEIELLYSLAEVLGHTVQLSRAAQIIVQEVAEVVGARRGSILVADEAAQVLHVAGAWGFSADELEPVPVDDPTSIAARAFREQRLLTNDPATPTTPGVRRQPYRGKAFLSVPIAYAPPGRPPRPMGVVNLTDRLGEDHFTESQRRLVTAVAHQIGAAIANARLVERDRARERVQRELELAHDLQLKLLPSVSLVAPFADVGARCSPAGDVGGDFYHLVRLRDQRLGAMIGDVSSHGFGAALIMALTISAAGIHAEATGSPAETLKRLADSLEPELQRTDMFLTLFYAVMPTADGELVWASAGHHHAFKIPGDGSDPERLPVTTPPLGLASPRDAEDARLPWRSGEDLLLLFTDGIVDARDVHGERFGERRLLEMVRRLRHLSTQALVDEIFAEVEAFAEGSEGATDDRTVLILRG